MNEQYSGTKPVAEAHRFDEKRLEDWLHHNVEGFQGPLEIQQFKGGQSNPTYRLVTPTKSYVLRRKPPGKLLKSAHAVDREFRVISALYPTGFPVAEPYALCEDESVIGTMFYVMDCVEGRIFWDLTLPALDREERRAIFDAKCRTLAQLHTTDWKSIGLEGYGREGEYVARQIHRWTSQYQASETESIAEMDALIEWLPKNIPAGETTTIVHGDYRLDNMIVAPDCPEILAVLDWELSTLGDPLADFTYHLMSWHLPPVHGDTGIRDIDNLEDWGIPTVAQYVARYCALTGRDGMPELDFYFAYNGFRLAAIVQGIVGRVRDGTASNANAEAMAKRVRPLAAFAHGFARKAGL